MVKKYRKKPIEVEAMLFDGTNGIEVVAWMGKAMAGHVKSYLNASSSVSIETLEGVMRASAGDYVIRGVKGEFYPCKPDIFNATYEEVLL